MQFSNMFWKEKRIAYTPNFEMAVFEICTKSLGNYMILMFNLFQYESENDTLVMKKTF